MATKFFISSPFIRTLIYANVFIAVCAFSQVLLTYHVFAIPVNYANNSYLLFVFLSTYLQYNMQRGYGINSGNTQGDRAQWLLKHRKKIMYSIGICLITVLFLCNNLSYLSIGIMVGAEILSTLYYLPPANLRRHGYIKPFLISLIWVISCAMVPLIENQLLNRNSLWFLIGQFCFIAVLCLLFDIKDAEEDYLNGINTYANKFGVSVTKIICALLLVAAVICFSYFRKEFHFLFGSVVFGTLILGISLLTNENKSPFYYYLLVDGLLIAQAGLFFLI